MMHPSFSQTERAESDQLDDSVFAQIYLDEDPPTEEETAAEDRFSAVAPLGLPVAESSQLSSDGMIDPANASAAVPPANAAGVSGVSSTGVVSAVGVSSGVEAAPVAPPSVERWVTRVLCPHCWHQFPVDQTLWVSQHTDLLGDHVLGPNAPSRFLPSRFDPDGNALDAREMVCHALACPRCHLSVPRGLLHTEPLVVSMIGASASGKSYLLTSTAWTLRQLLPAAFGVSFTDGDPVLNRTLAQYEETLFLPSDPARPVKLEKTDIAGAHLYDQIRLGQHVLNLPKPFVFSMRPARGHPGFARAEELARTLCFYDNAGEHFNPGEESPSSPVTQHLSRARAILFLYDPTQDPRLRAMVRDSKGDPQLQAGWPVRRQETLLSEAAARVRRFAGLAPGAPTRQPLIVVVPKADVWGRVIGLDLSKEPIVPGASARGWPAAVDIGRIETVSATVRKLFCHIAPEFVSAAEEFSSNVVYIPVSALGASPRSREGFDGLWIRPQEIVPRWVTVPILYMFARWSHGLLARGSSASLQAAMVGPPSSGLTGADPTQAGHA